MTYIKPMESETKDPASLATALINKWLFGKPVGLAEPIFWLSLKEFVVISPRPLIVRCPCPPRFLQNFPLI